MRISAKIRLAVCDADGFITVITDKSYRTYERLTFMEQIDSWNALDYSVTCGML